MDGWIGWIVAVVVVVVVASQRSEDGLVGGGGIRNGQLSSVLWLVNFACGRWQAYAEESGGPVVEQNVEGPCFKRVTWRRRKGQGNGFHEEPRGTPNV